MSRRTGGFTAICVLALLLGAMGLFSSLGGVLGLIAGDRLQQSVLQAQAAADPGLEEAQRQMQQEIAEVTDRYRPFQWAQTVVQLLLSVSIMVAAVLALRLRPPGRRLLLALLIAAAVLTPIQSVLAGFILRESAPIMRKGFQQLAEQAAPPGNRQPPGFRQLMGGIAEGVIVMQWVVLLGWAALKCAFYLFGAWYLTWPAVVAVFETRSESPGVELTRE